MPDLHELLPASLALELEPFDDDELDRALDVDGDAGPVYDPADVYVPAPLRWEIEDPRSAEWAMRKLAAYQADIADRLREAVWYAEQITRWKEQQTAPLLRRARHFENLLADYAYRVRSASGGKIKTVKLPAGEVTTRGSEGEGKVVLADRVAFLAWVAGELPAPMRRLFVRAEPLPITDIRKSVTVARVVPHLDVHFSDEHVFSMPAERAELVDTYRDENAAMVCPVCGEPGRTIIAVEHVPESYTIRINRELAGEVLDDDDIMLEPDELAGEVPGLGYELDDLSVTVKPYR